MEVSATIFDDAGEPEQVTQSDILHAQEKVLTLAVESFQKYIPLKSKIPLLGKVAFAVVLMYCSMMASEYL